MNTPSPRPRRPRLSEYLGRSLLPLAALLLFGSTLLWGPYGFALAALAWWRATARFA